MSEYANHGKKWTVKEIKQLLKEVKTIDLKDIAQIHKRTPYAIYLKLVKEASKIADEDYDISLEELSKTVGLTPETLLTGFKKIKYDFIRIDDDTDSENDDNDYDDYNSDQDDNEEEKQEEVVVVQPVIPLYISLIIIMINLSGFYYHFYINRLI